MTLVSLCSTLHCAKDLRDKKISLDLSVDDSVIFCPSDLQKGPHPALKTIDQNEIFDEASKFDDY